MKRILSTTAVLALIAAPTFAQVSADAGADVDAQVSTDVDTRANVDADATVGADVATEREADPGADPQRPPAAGMTLTSDALMDAEIHDSEGEVVGTVADLVVDTDGRLQQVVAEVGGFVGQGVREVALDRSQVDIQAEDETDVRIELTMPLQEVGAMSGHEG